MKRRSFRGKAAGLVATMTDLSGMVARPAAGDTSKSTAKGLTISNSKLKPPPNGCIPVAVTIPERVTVIDFTGPWEYFKTR